MSGNQNKMLPVQVVVAVLALLGNIALIPLFGIKAAAVVSVLAVAATNLFFLRVVWNKMRLFPYNASYLRLIIPIAATATTIWAMHAKLSGTLPAIPLLVLVFVVSYAVFLMGVVAFGLTEDDRVVVKLAREKIGPFFSRNIPSR